MENDVLRSKVKSHICSNVGYFDGGVNCLAYLKYCVDRGNDYFVVGYWILHVAFSQIFSIASVVGSVDIVLPCIFISSLRFLCI